MALSTHSGNAKIISDRLGVCQVCKGKNSKYKCPRCELSTCSLICVNKHKFKFKCNGLRNKTKLIHKNEMNNLTVLSDYRLLEEIDHKLDDGLRNPLRKYIVKRKIEGFPQHLRKLKKRALEQRMFLKFTPQSFSMRQENSTLFHYQDNKIKWHIKFVFPQAEFSFINKSVDEDTLLLSLLMPYMQPRQDFDGALKDCPLTDETASSLAFYHAASYSRITLLYKSCLSRFSKRYVEIPFECTVKNALKNKVVVEYPVFYVVLNDSLDAYIDRESDDSEEENSCSPTKAKDGNRRMTYFDAAALDDESDG